MPTKCLKSDFFKVLSTWKWKCTSQDVWSKGSIITPNIYELVWCGQRTAQEILLEFVVSSVALLCATVSERGFQHGRNNTLLTNYCSFPSIIPIKSQVSKKSAELKLQLQKSEGFGQVSSLLSNCTQYKNQDLRTFADICVLLRLICVLFAVHKK